MVSGRPGMGGFRRNCGTVMIVRGVSAAVAVMMHLLLFSRPFSVSASPTFSADEKSATTSRPSCPKFPLTGQHRLFGGLVVAFQHHNGSPSCEEAMLIIQQHLTRTSPISDFYVQGWRWHTLSLIRESNRLSKATSAVLRQQRQRGAKSDCTSSFRIAADYVVNFNMRGLHKIEGNLFLPWIAQRLITKQQPKEMTRALNVILEDLAHVRERVGKCGVELMDAVTMLDGDEGNDLSKSMKWLDVVARQSAAISQQSRHILDTADELLVPLIQRSVSESDQKAFNSRVIRLLGLWDSRLHLVGMHQATKREPNERALFQKIIPKFPQSMIPRWKRLLYDPKVEALSAFD